MWKTWFNNTLNIIIKAILHVNADLMKLMNRNVITVVGLGILRESALLKEGSEE